MATITSCCHRVSRSALGPALRRNGAALQAAAVAALPIQGQQLEPQGEVAAPALASKAGPLGGLQSLDEFGLISKASLLLQRKWLPDETSLLGVSTSDVSAWQALADRAANVLMMTRTPGALAWLLDAIAQADLHPSERAHLAFPRLFRQEACASPESVGKFSDDELCLIWSALERLTLLDKQTSLLLYRAAIKRPDGGGPQRCQKFSLQNWVRVAVGLRGFQRQHPLHMEFVESTVLRLLVQSSEQLRKCGLQIEALDAVSRMTVFTSRQVHRVTATLHAHLESMTPAELVLLPRLCTRARLQDETLFTAFVERLTRLFHTLALRDYVSLWRTAFHWRVGLPAAFQSAGCNLAESVASVGMDTFPPRAILRLLRAFGRLDAETLRARRSSDLLILQREQMALAGLLATSLQALPRITPSFDAAELLLATNALGQVARAWSWLDTDMTESDNTEKLDPIAEMRHGTECLSEAVHWQLQIIDTQHVGEHGSSPSDFLQYTDRDLAVLCLAFSRAARRSFSPGAAPSVSMELCRRLSVAASTGSDVDAGSAALQATSMLIAHIARSPTLHMNSPEHTLSSVELAAAALECMQAWAQSVPGQAEIHKAVASSAALGGQLVRLQASVDFQTKAFQGLTRQLCDMLPFLVNMGMRHQGSTDFSRAAEVLESWHLDGCVYAATVYEALVGATVYRMGEAPELAILQAEMHAVIAELCSRRGSLSESSVRFWSARLCEPRLLAHRVSIPHQLCAQLLILEDAETQLDPAVGAALRDMSFLLQS